MCSDYMLYMELCCIVVTRPRQCNCECKETLMLGHRQQNLKQQMELRRQLNWILETAVVQIGGHTSSIFETAAVQIVGHTSSMFEPSVVHIVGHTSSIFETAVVHILGHTSSRFEIAVVHIAGHTRSKDLHLRHLRRLLYAVGRTSSNTAGLYIAAFSWQWCEGQAKSCPPPSSHSVCISSN